MRFWRISSEYGKSMIIHKLCFNDEFKARINNPIIDKEILL